MLSAATLEQENFAYAGTGGVSAESCSEGFCPAFMDLHTGRVEPARFADGQPAPMHVIDGLPREWGGRFDSDGRIIALKASIVSGFLRGGHFFTREQAATLARQGRNG